MQTEKAFINSRYLIWIFAAVSLVILAGSYVFWSFESRSLIRQKHENLKAITGLKTDQIIHWREERIAEATYFSKRETVIQNARLLQSDSSGYASSDYMDTMFQHFNLGHNYSNIYLVNENGKVLWSLLPMHDRVNTYTLENIQTALKDTSVYFADFYKADGKIYLELVAPLITKDNLVTAFLVLENDPFDFLFPLIQTWPDISKSGETILLRQEEDSILFLNELRHLSNSALNLKLSLTQIETPAVQAVLGYEGIFKGTDYRGVKVLSDVRHIPETKWYMIAKEDISEVYGELNSKGFIIFYYAILCITLLVLSLTWVYKDKQKNLFKAMFLQEKDLRKAEQLFKTTLYSIGDGVITTDGQSAIIQMNRVAEELTGWTEQEASGLRLSEVFRIVNEDTGETMENPADKVLKEGKIVGLANHTLLISRSGKKISIADSGAPIVTAEGKTIGVVLVFKDQTEERAYQNALRDSEHRLRVTLDNMMEGCQIIGFDWKYRYVNDALCKQAKKSPEEILGLTMMEAFPGIEQSAMYHELKRCMAGKQNHLMENKFDYPDGSSGWFELSIQPSPEGLFILSFDITRRKELENQLLQAMKMESLGTLAGGIAHDFNNILGIILGYANRISQVHQDPQQVNESVLAIRQATERGTDLIMQLLAFARKSDTHFQPLKINSVIEDLSKLISGTFPKTIELKMELAEDLPLLLADSSQIHQVLINLCVNARDAMPSGGQMGISTSAVKGARVKMKFPEVTAHQYIQVEVTDNGVGMEKSIQGKIFEPFFTTKEVGKGTGLGLSLVYSIVTNHQGFIQVQSHPGKGTVVSIYLPVPKDPIEVQPPKPVSGEHHFKGTETLLVIEDEPMLLDLLDNYLRSLGYRVITATNGMEGIQLFREHHKVLNMVILDMGLPKMDGAQVFQALKELDPDVRVVVTSGYIAPELSHKLMHSGVRSIIKKPYDISDLMEELRAVLDS